MLQKIWLKILRSELFLCLITLIVVVAIFFDAMGVFLTIKSLVPDGDIVPFLYFLLFLCNTVGLFLTISNIRKMEKKDQPVLDWNITKTRVNGLYHLTIEFIDLKYPTFIKSIECPNLEFSEPLGVKSTSNVIMRKIPSTRFQKEPAEKYRLQVAFRIARAYLNEKEAEVTFKVSDGNLPSVKIILPI